MSFLIKEIQNQEQWEAFSAKINPNTFLHSWEWGQVNQADGNTVRYVGIYKTNELIGIALLITVKAKRGTFILCPHGPLFLHQEQFEQYLPKLIAYIRKLALQDGAVALRVAPLLETSPTNNYILRNNKFRPAPMHMHSELTWVLNIVPTEEKLLSSMRKTTRHAINKARTAGVQVEIHTSPHILERFWSLYHATGERQNFVPFSRKFIQHQLEIFSQKNRIYIIMATHQGKDVAAGIFIHYNSTVFYHHGASQRLSQAIPAAQLLQWASIQEAKRRGATTYNFWGIAPPDKPRHPFAGITTFKKGFGGQAIDYLHAHDLPLSFKYWKLWLVDSYRKYKRGF